MSGPPLPTSRPVVLFIVTSFWAHGELTIAVEFARRFDRMRFDSLFLIPPSHRRMMSGTGLRYQILIPLAAKINKCLLRDIKETWRPTLVVLADFLNFDFCERHYGLRREDLDIFTCPLGTFDNFSWGRPGSWMDTYGFVAHVQGEITLDGLRFRLRPCPLNKPPAPGDRAAAGSRIYPYPLFDLTTLAERARGAARRQARRELAIPSGKPLILLAGAQWQCMHSAYAAATGFVQACTAALEQLLRGLLQDATVVAVGSPLVFRDASPPGFHYMGELHPLRFRRLAEAADLHISTNVTSVSLHRLALSGVQSVVLYSSLMKTESGIRSVAGNELPMAYRDGFPRSVGSLYPFYMFPVGWYSFLRSLVAGNPFMDFVPRIEIFHEQHALRTIGSLLGPTAYRANLEAARRRYLERLAQFGDVNALLERVLAEASR